MNPEPRFTQGVSWLSDVTCMLDVTTIPCRARKPREAPDGTTRGSTYSGKHRQHCFKVEVWLTLAGVPFFFRGPVVGSMHDAKIYMSTSVHRTPLFTHHEDEMFLADLGYIGCAHCLVPYKKTGCGLTDDEKRVNERISLIRSRIERRFAHFDKFRFLHGTDHDISWVRDAFQIVSVVTYGLLATQPQYVFDSIINLSLKSTSDEGECLCSKGCGVVDGIESCREWLKENIDGVAYEPKKSNKCAK